MEFRLKPVETIVAKIVRDLGLGDKEIPYQDYIEWIYEGLQLIGAYSQYKENLMVELPIEDYRVKLPVDFFSLMANPHLRYKRTGDVLIVENKTGKIKLNYLSLPVDERGYPLVPDNVSYDEALKWKVAMMLTLRGELKQIGYELAVNRWNLYCKQARAQGNAFTADEMERLADTRTRFPQDIHQYDVDFQRVSGRFKQDTPNGRK